MKKSKGKKKVAAKKGNVLVAKLKKKIDKIKHHLKKVHADAKSMIRLKQIEYHLNSILKRKK